MARIVLATFGSLGDIHPMIALGLELQQRGHSIVFAAMNFYREKIGLLGFEFRPLAPHFDIEDKVLAAKLLDPANGPENLIKDTIFPELHQMYRDLMAAVDGADLFVTGEVVYAAKSVAEKTGIKWVSTSLAPLSMFSSYDPNVYPQTEWYENLFFLPPVVHQGIFAFVKWMVSTRGLYDQYIKFRRDIGLSEDHDPVFFGKASPLLHLAMFSRGMAVPQPDWYPSTVQTGFCFYDGQNDMGKMPDALRDFLADSEAAGEPPIVFTLGSAAVMDAGAFYDESVKAAKLLNRRAVMLYGVFNIPPAGLNSDIVGFDYAPHSLVFARAACVVHSGGIGTTAQVLRAGIPMLVIPFANDQPDNAARCRRLGVARTIDRFRYTGETAAHELRQILDGADYQAKARGIKSIIDAENGTQTACDAIENVLQK